MSTHGRPRRSALLKMREAAAVVLMRLVSPLLAKPKKSKLSTPRVQEHRARKEERRRKRLAQVEACNKKRRRTAPAAAAAASSAENSSAPAPLQCPICLEDLDDTPALACGHQFHAACMQELAATAWANGATRTRGRGTAVLCPLCREQSYVQYC